MTAPSTPHDPWDDRRLEAAFTARAARARTPDELVANVVARMRTEDPPMPVWRRWLPAAAVVLLAAGVVAGGIALSGDVRGRGLFREGPTAGLKTLDAGDFAFDYPAGWLGYDASASGSGVSSVAVLGTQPVERRCGNERHVDLNCVYEQRIEAGQIRLFVGTGAYRGQTIEDRAPIENGTTSRVRVGGMPAIFDEFDPRPDSLYGEDTLIHWEIARPGSDGTNVVRLEAMLKEPGVDEGRRQLEALIASFRFTNGPDPSTAPTPKPTPTEAPPSLSDLRVMTVEELISAAELPTAEEVVVRGWLARSSTIFDCLRVLPAHPLRPQCDGNYVFLLGREESIDGLGPNTPSVPHVVPIMARDMHLEVDFQFGRAVEVTALGHLADHRWTSCPEATQPECKARFVIDRIVPAGEALGDDLPVPWASPSDRPVDDPIQAIDALTGVVGGITVVSIGNADADSVRSIEPLVQEINNEQGAWVIRALVGGDAEPVARTFLVGHIGWWTVSEVTEAGVVDLMGQSPSEPPTDVLGLPVISVEEAMAVRDAGRDDREIAVRGWVPPLRSMRCRELDPPLSFFLELDCQSALAVMTGTRQVIVSSPPDGAFISVAFDEIAWQPGRADGLGPIRATEAVLIGHFDDRRSGWCHATRIEACRDRFVVDGVAWEDGETQATSVVTRSGTNDAAFEPVESAVSTAAGGPILSATAYTTEEYVKVEPSLRDGRPGLTDERIVWSVRVLEEERVVTYLVVDGTDRVYRVERDGQTVQVGGSPPQDPDRPWPPAGGVDVPLQRLPTGFVAKAGVVDRSGLLLDARAAGDGDPRGPPRDFLSGEMSIVQAAPDTIVAYWDGSFCDDQFVLTIYGERAGVQPDRLELRGESADSCRLALAHRGIVLRFSQPVAAAAIRGWDRVGTRFETFPPVDSTVVFLPKGGGFELPRVRVALVDLSGRIKAVRLPRADEPRPNEQRDGTGALVPDPSAEGRYHLMWNGGICTSDIVITIDASMSSVVVSNPVPGDCDTIPNEYRLLLDIEGRLDPPAVEVDYAETSAGAS